MATLRVGVDSSVMVAAVCAWHEHHAASLSELESRLARGQHLLVPAHSLAETYAVLTRLPPPHRLAGVDAWRLVQHNFINAASVIGLAPDEYPSVIEALAREAITGGQTYDALIAQACVVARADLILTFNRRHFERVAPHLPVVVPGT